MSFFKKQEEKFNLQKEIDKLVDDAYKNPEVQKNWDDYNKRIEEQENTSKNVS